MKFRWNPRQSFRDYWNHLIHSRDAPHAVAGGVAIGIFWGFTPLTGLKTLLSICTAWLTRCSKIPAVVSVALHDVLAPVWPIFLRWEYDLGYWLCSQPHHFPPALHINKLRLAELFEWKTLALLGPTFVGSCVIGIPLAVASYWGAKMTLERYQQRCGDRPLAPSSIARTG